jgi:hypothetical protein
VQANANTSNMINSVKKLCYFLNAAVLRVL